MSDQSATSWDAFLAQTELTTRVKALPRELRESLAELVEACCDLADEACVDPRAPDYGEQAKVQTSSAEGTVHVVRNQQFWWHLKSGLASWTQRERTIIRTMLATGEAPRSAPRFRPRKA